MLIRNESRCTLRLDESLDRDEAAGGEYKISSMHARSEDPQALLEIAENNGYSVESIDMNDDVIFINVTKPFDDPYSGFNKGMGFIKINIGRR